MNLNPTKLSGTIQKPIGMLNGVSSSAIDALPPAMLEQALFIFATSTNDVEHSMKYKDVLYS